MTQPTTEAGYPFPTVDGASTLLNTMALLKANYNDGRDYLTNFEPFVANVLKEKWPDGKPVRPEILRDVLGARFSIPSMPINTADVLKVRAVDHGWIRRDSSSDFFPDSVALDAVRGLKPGTDQVLKHLEHLIEALRVYAKDGHQLDWRAEAPAALERFVEEFSFELAMAKRGEDQLKISSVSDDLALTVVNGFVRQVFAHKDRRMMHYLEEMVQGSMLANVLYFNDLGQWSENLSGLTVYLDTTVALRVLKLTHDSLAQATAEMMDLLRKLDVNVRIFDHTVDEMHGVLVGVATSLRKGRASAGDPKETGRMNREVTDAAVQRNLQPADIEAIAADLNRHLIRSGVQPEPTPERPERMDVDESRLRELLRSKISYKWTPPLEKDVMSAMAIHVLRRGREWRRLGKTPALFVTANPELARLTQEFFSEDTVTGAIPHVIVDISLTTQLWVRRPAGHRDLPGRLLIAESHAALSEGPELWERYLHMIERQRDEDRIDDQQVKALVYAMESRESFLKVTHGNPDAVDEGTPLEVLDHIRSEIEDRANEKVQQASAETAAIASERDFLRQAVMQTKERLEEQAAELVGKQEAIEALETFTKKRRRVAGTAGAAIAVIAALALPLMGVVSGSLQIAAVSSGFVFLAVLSAAWGYRKGGGWVLAAIGAIGVVLTVPVGIKTIADSDKDSASKETVAPEPAKQTPAPKAKRSKGQSPSSPADP